MRKAAAQIGKLISKGDAESRERLPAGNIVNQLPGATLPPGGPSGDGYPAKEHNHTDTGDGGKLTAPVLDSYAVLEETSAPSSPASNTLRLYAKDKAGVTEFFYKNSSGTERDLSTISGTIEVTDGSTTVDPTTTIVFPAGTITNNGSGEAEYTPDMSALATHAADTTAIHGIADTSLLLDTADIGASVQAYDADLAAIAALADPNADRILFWDDSAGAYAHLAPGAGLTITGTTIDTQTLGTWTPTYLGSSTPGTTTYTVQVGRYALIGEMCFFTVRVDWSAASGTGNAQVSLPFTAKNTTNQSWSASVYPINVTFAASGLVALISPNTAFAVLNSPTSNAGSSIVQIEAAGTIIISGFYEKA